MGRPSRLGVIINEDHALVPLTQGKFAIIDIADVPLIENHTWCVVKRGRSLHAMRGVRPSQGRSYESIYLHRAILDIKDTVIQVDHIDGNGLNNRRANLRPCSIEENVRNKRSRLNSSSEYVGVYWNKIMGIWGAQIACKNKTTHLGFFKDAKIAAIAYDIEALKNYGEFARTNFLKRSTILN